VWEPRGTSACQSYSSWLRTRGQIVVCEKCEGALDRDGHCPRCERKAAAEANPQLELSEEASGHRIMGGWSFIQEQPADVEAVWGSGGEVLWSPGEPMLLVGPQGVGKTTLAQRVALARIGLRPDPVLGFLVQVTDEPVLYVAADRPAQAARSLRRMVRGAGRGGPRRSAEGLEGTAALRPGGEA
jgi:hypothetical protein